MNETPLVTVVIPTWNRLPLLREAIASVMAQTYPRWELVVVDDGSTDGTSERVMSLGDPRVQVITLARTHHIGRARNVGAAAGSGELVAFLDSDDLWLPNKLQAQVRALKGTDAGWCYTGFEMMDAHGRALPMRAGTCVPLSGWIAGDVLTTRAAVSISTLLVRRSTFDAAGRFSEDPRLVNRGDFELHLRLAAHSPAIAVPDVLVRMRDHAARTTASVTDPHERTALAYELFLETNPAPELRRVARRIRADHLATAGAQRLARGETRPAITLFARSLAQHPTPGHWTRSLARGVRGLLRRDETA
jgi:glycosyltransferase involved in cell wall biosynthesis